MSYFEYSDYLKTKEWKEIRAKIFARDKHCQVCSKKSNLQVHHITYDEKVMKGIDLSELICLCEDCHEKVETMGKSDNEYWNNVTRKRYYLFSLMKRISGIDLYEWQDNIHKLERRLFIKANDIQSYSNNNEELDEAFWIFYNSIDNNHVNKNTKKKIMRNKKPFGIKPNLINSKCKIENKTNYLIQRIQEKKK